MKGSPMVSKVRVLSKEKKSIQSEFIFVGFHPKATEVIDQVLLKID